LPCHRGLLLRSCKSKPKTNPLERKKGRRGARTLGRGGQQLDEMKLDPSINLKYAEIRLARKNRAVEAREKSRKRLSEKIVVYSWGFGVDSSLSLL